MHAWVIYMDSSIATQSRVTNKEKSNARGDDRWQSKNLLWRLLIIKPPISKIKNKNTSCTYACSDTGIICYFFSCRLLMTTTMSSRGSGLGLRLWAKTTKGGGGFLGHHSETTAAAAVGFFFWIVFWRELFFGLFTLLGKYQRVGARIYQAKFLVKCKCKTPR